MTARLGAWEETQAALLAMADQFLHPTGMLTEVAHDDPDSTLGWCGDQAEFEFGLDLILDELERLAVNSQRLPKLPRHFTCTASRSELPARLSRQPAQKCLTR